MALDRGHDAGHGVPVLDVKVEPRARKRRHEFVEAGHGLHPADPHPPDLVRGEVVDPAAAVGDPVKGAVVEEEQLTVGRGVDVRLKVVKAKFDGGAERRQRVFQALQRESAVRHGHRTA